MMNEDLDDDNDDETSTNVNKTSTNTETSTTTFKDSKTTTTSTSDDSQTKTSTTTDENPSTTTKHNNEDSAQTSNINININKPVLPNMVIAKTSFKPVSRHAVRNRVKTKNESSSMISIDSKNKLVQKRIGFRDGKFVLSDSIWHHTEAKSESNGKKHQDQEVLYKNKEGWFFHAFDNLCY